jgi:hypothetical protein
MVGCTTDSRTLHQQQHRSSCANISACSHRGLIQAATVSQYTHVFVRPFSDGSST